MYWVGAGGLFPPTSKTRTAEFRVQAHNYFSAVPEKLAFPIATVPVRKQQPASPTKLQGFVTRPSACQKGESNIKITGIHKVEATNREQV